MTTSNAVPVDKTIPKAGEKLAEKRRALGRGLESLVAGAASCAGGFHSSANCADGWGARFFC